MFGEGKLTCSDCLYLGNENRCRRERRAGNTYGLEDWAAVNPVYDWCGEFRSRAVPHMGVIEICSHHSDVDSFRRFAAREPNTHQLERDRAELATVTRLMSKLDNDDVITRSGLGARRDELLQMISEQTKPAGDD